MPMENPSALLAFLAAVLRPSAPSALGELPRELFPFPALVVGAVSDSASAVVFPAEVTHYYASPVLHVLAVVTDGELLDEREDVEVVWEEVFFFFGVAGGGNRRGG